jgi:DNA helicase-2/ATP-dependent DNA helicase PcrA
LKSSLRKISALRVQAFAEIRIFATVKSKSMSKIFEGLNPSQAEGVAQTEGPVLLIAGAGSGKTRVLTFRIANLIEKGVAPYQILALTFTNKAAREMRERIEKIVGDKAKQIWMGTFHSVFAKILRIEASAIGFTSNFTIYDTEDSKLVIKNIIRDFGLDEKIYDVSTVYGRISSAKNQLVTPQMYAVSREYYDEDKYNKKPEIARIYTTYTQRCKTANAMDFDDLLLYTFYLLKTNPAVAEKYQNKFKYILVDEFQDTNPAQYQILRILAEKHKNICVVGDDAQSIYAFRGADISNILDFEKDFAGAKVIKLEQNYRSTQIIIEAANSVIQRNKEQIKKSVWTDNHAGDLIDIIKATTDAEEARLIASSIYEEKMRHSLPNSEFAVLYRTNAQSRAIEEALRRTGLKYKIFGGLSFYQRKEIKDLMAYFKFTLNHNDEEAFRRIINYPKRGLGETTIDKIFEVAHLNGITIWEVVKNFKKHFGANRASVTVENFVMLIEHFTEMSEKKDAYETAVYIAKHSGLAEALKADQTVEGQSRFENAMELLNAVKEFTDNDAQENKSLAYFCQDVALITDADQEDPSQRDYITLMTIHSAKGLEFRNVYIAGLEEELFPSSRMTQSRKDLEEERRLFYVAVTRAKKKLTLGYALQRYRFGSLRRCEPSRFLSEIRPDVLSDRNFGREEYFSQKRPAAPQPRPTPNLHTAVKKPANERTIEYDEEFKPSPPSEIRVGMRVAHLKFGYGKVLDIVKTGAGDQAKILFETVGEKTLILAFAKLKIV